VPWARVSLAAPVPAEEVQRRLAVLTAEWVATGWATPVPPPPWKGDAFAATVGALFVSFIPPVVVSGVVRADARGARLEAVLRPHGVSLVTAALAPFLALAIFRGPLAFGIVLFGLFGLGGYVILTGACQKRFPRILATLERACWAADGVEPSSSGGE
jgi:hypothetical protein